MSFPD